MCKSPIRLRSAALLLVLLAACRRSPVPALADPKHPCTLLTDEDVTQALHLLNVEQRPIEQASVIDTSNGGTSTTWPTSLCSISAGLDPKTRRVFSIGYCTPEEFEQQRSMTKTAQGGRVAQASPSQTVAGVGDQSFWNSETGWAGVCKGALCVVTNGADDLASAAALLARVASHLP
jgi:hypothetical protein